MSYAIGECLNYVTRLKVSVGLSEKKFPAGSSRLLTGAQVNESLILDLRNVWACT